MKRIKRSLTLPSLARRAPPSPAGGGGNERRSRERVRAFAVIAMAFALAGCLAMEAPTAIQPTAPGFWLGVWHGFIFPVTFVFSIFTDDVAVYAVPNNGSWYDAGYFVGIVFLGVGARSAKRR